MWSCVCVNRPYTEKLNCCLKIQRNVLAIVKAHLLNWPAYKPREEGGVTAVWMVNQNRNSSRQQQQQDLTSWPRDWTLFKQGGSQVFAGGLDQEPNNSQCNRPSRLLAAAGATYEGSLTQGCIIFLHIFWDLSPYSGVNSSMFSRKGKVFQDF